MGSKKKEVVPSDSESSEPEPVKEEKKPAKKNAYAAMQSSDSESEPEEKPVEKKKKSKETSGKDEKKDKKDKDEKKDKKDKKGKKEKKEKKPAPIICEVKSVKAVPKKDNLKVCEVIVGPGDTVEIVTNAPNIVAGSVCIAALPGVTTANGIEVAVRKVGGVESTGMFCGPKEMGWDTDVLDENLAVLLDPESPIGKPNPTYEEAIQAFEDRQKKAAATASAKKEAGEKGKKKKKGGKKAESDDEDLDAILGEFQDKKDESPAAVEKAEEPAERAEP